MHHLLFRCAVHDVTMTPTRIALGVSKTLRCNLCPAETAQASALQKSVADYAKQSEELLLSSLFSVFSEPLGLWSDGGSSFHSVKEPCFETPASESKEA